MANKGKAVMQVFSREIMAKVARQFYWYYNKKARSITMQEALALIDYELDGSSKPPTGIGSMDYSKPVVKSSNISKPTKSEIDQIASKYDRWDSVFEELMAKIQGDREMMKFILLVFKHQYNDEQVSSAMHITRTTYYRYRSTILTKAAIIAIVHAVIRV